MASIIQKKRLSNEAKLLINKPLHYCTAYPDESNPLIWYFLIMGQKDTDYHNGEYIGKIIHSPKYPIEPPDYMMLTPSGRYSIGTKICLTNSSYHKGDWSSTWNILSILIGFYSIWLDDKEHGLSHITDTPTNRQKMARESISYNLKNNAAIYEKFDRTHLKDDLPIVLMKKKEENIVNEPIPQQQQQVENIVNEPILQQQQQQVENIVNEPIPQQQQIQFNLPKVNKAKKIKK